MLEDIIQNIPKTENKFDDFLLTLSWLYLNKKKKKKKKKKKYIYIEGR